MVSRKSSSSSNKTSTSTDTMIETIGKPQTVNTSYTSSHDFIPSRPPPPLKLVRLWRTPKKILAVLNHQKYLNKINYKNFPKIIQKTSSSSLNKKHFIKITRQREENKGFTEPGLTRIYRQTILLIL